VRAGANVLVSGAKLRDEGQISRQWIGSLRIKALHCIDWHEASKPGVDVNTYLKRVLNMQRKTSMWYTARRQWALKRAMFQA
jgi:hypothetical protein